MTTTKRTAKQSAAVDTAAAARKRTAADAAAVEAAETETLYRVVRRLYDESNGNPFAAAIGNALATAANRENAARVTVDRLIGELSTLRADLATATAAAGAARADLAAGAAAAAKTHAEDRELAEDRAGQIAALNREIDSARAERDKLAAAVDIAGRAYADLRAELAAEHQRGVAAVGQALAVRESELATLRAQLAAANASRVEASKQAHAATHAARERFAEVLAHTDPSVVASAVMFAGSGSPLVPTHVNGRPVPPPVAAAAREIAIGLAEERAPAAASPFVFPTFGGSVTPAAPPARPAAPPAAPTVKAAREPGDDAAAGGPSVVHAIAAASWRRISAQRGGPCPCCGARISPSEDIYGSNRTARGPAWVCSDCWTAYAPNAARGASRSA